LTINNLRGDKYQWGAKIPSIKEQNDDYTRKEVPNWDKKGVEIGHDWEDNNIPCPKSWRIPTKNDMPIRCIKCHRRR